MQERGTRGATPKNQGQGPACTLFPLPIRQTSIPKGSGSQVMVLLGPRTQFRERSQGNTALAGPSRTNVSEQGHGQGLLNISCCLLQPFSNFFPPPG